MVRKLKYHEGKLLRKVDFLSYPQENKNRAAIIRRYGIQKVDDYEKYNKIAGSLRQLAHRLSLLPPESAVRAKVEKQLLDKLYDMGVLSNTARLSEVEHKATVSALARRRLAVVLTRLRMAPTVSKAVEFIEQGHVRVGVEEARDPAFLVTRSMEDFVTWTNGSKIKRNIAAYRDEVDDYEML